MSELDDYRQKMKERFEREQKLKSSNSGLMRGLFQNKEEPAESSNQNVPMSDYEFAKQMQENELKGGQGSDKVVYDFRGGNNNQFQAPPVYRNQNFPAEKETYIEMNDFGNPNNTSDKIPLRSTMDTRHRITRNESKFGFLTSYLNEQMTPVAKYCCYLAGIFLFLIFILVIKSL